MAGGGHRAAARPSSLARLALPTRPVALIASKTLPLNWISPRRAAKSEHKASEQKAEVQNPARMIRHIPRSPSLSLALPSDLLRTLPRAFCSASQPLRHLCDSCYRGII